MDDIISKAALEARRILFLPGSRVELVSMNDPYIRLKPGERGTVEYVDDIGTVHIQWDNGSTLGAVFGADVIKIASPKITDAVRNEIIAIRAHPDCPNMFDTNAVQRLAFDLGYYFLVDYIESDRKAYAHFILTGKER